MSVESDLSPFLKALLISIGAHCPVCMLYVVFTEKLDHAILSSFPPYAHLSPLALTVPQTIQGRKIGPRERITFPLSIIITID